MSRGRRETVHLNFWGFNLHMTANTYWIVRMVLGRFAVPVIPSMERLMRRLPLISLLGSFSVVSIFYIYRFDVDNMGRGVYFQVLAVGAVFSVLINFAVAQYFLVRNVANEEVLKNPVSDISWRPVEFLAIGIFVVSLVLIGFLG
jgi:hypothetical protein